MTVLCSLRATSGCFRIFQPVDTTKLLMQAFIYMAGVQLLFASSRQTLFGAACGLIAGIAYRTNFLGLQKLQVSHTSLQASNATPLAPTKAQMCGVHFHSSTKQMDV